MSKTELVKNIMDDILNIFSLVIKKMEGKCIYFDRVDINKRDILNKYKDINFLKGTKISFETKDLYQYFIIRIYDYLSQSEGVYFNSIYSAIYFRRIINYLQKLFKSNTDIVEDDLIKIFFFLLFLFFDENSLDDRKKSQIQLDEAFFKGSFFELTEKYSSQVQYQEPQEIADLINSLKNEMEKKILKLIDCNFQEIFNLIEKYGNQTDNLMLKMKEDIRGIWHQFDISNNLSDDLINKIKNFFLEKKYLVFTNYISETEVDDLKLGIDEAFLNNIETQYLPFEFNYSSENNSLNMTEHKNKLKEYIEYRNRYYKRMRFSIFSEIFKLDFQDEINIIALAEYSIPSNFEKVHKLRNKIENLNQNDIFKIINEILNENDFYESYFSILKCNIVKMFFTSNLYKEEKGKEFQLINYKAEDSECFDSNYFNFIEEYDKKGENYKDFKKILILKILPTENRAYTVSHLKKIVISPTLFFLGKDIKKDHDEIKTILKGYLMVILLHETEHFFRLLDKDNKVFNNRSREKEGGRLFIKYLFGVESINHININQSKIILNSDSWKEPKVLKEIFINQLEDCEEDNINTFILNYFPNSISFFSIKDKKGNNRQKSKIFNYIKK